MSYVKTSLLLMGLILMWGCEDPELIKCQEDNQVLLGQVEKLELESAGQKEQVENQAGMLMDVKAESDKKIAAVTKERNTARTAQKKSQDQVKKVQAELKEAKVQINELRLLLAGAKEKVQNSGEILLVQSKENEKLKKQKSELEMQAAELEKQIESMKNQIAELQKQEEKVEG